MMIQTTQQGEEVKKGIQWRVGCGDRFKFWEDKWIDGEVSLVVKYPRLFLISGQQNQLIQQMGGYKDGEWKKEGEELVFFQSYLDYKAQNAQMTNALGNGNVAHTPDVCSKIPMVRSWTSVL